jgi:hypothetical protein
MKNLRWLVTVVCLLSLGACKDFGGSLSVQNKITLLKDVQSNSSSWDEEEEEDPRTEIQPGSYSAKLTIQGKKSIGLRVDIAKRNSPTFTFKTDKNLKDLRSGDRIQISAKKSGQPYDVDGVYTSETTSTDIESATVSCTYVIQEYRCHQETIPQTCENVHHCNPHDPTQCVDQLVCTGGETNSVCGMEDVTLNGQHWVEFFYSTTTDRLNLALLNGASPIAQFAGSDSSSNKIYTHQDVCH